MFQKTRYILETVKIYNEIKKRIINGDCMIFIIENENNGECVIYSE